MKNREIAQLIQARFQEKAPLIQVLIGPRQVGKTTLIRALFEGRGLYETADSPVPLRHEVIGEWWKKSLQTPDKILIIDEVQKIKGWSEVIKKLWDAEIHSMAVPRLPKVLLTGSSALLVEKGLKSPLKNSVELLVS